MSENNGALGVLEQQGAWNKGRVFSKIDSMTRSAGNGPKNFDLVFFSPLTTFGNYGRQESF